MPKTDARTETDITLRSPQSTWRDRLKARSEQLSQLWLGLQRQPKWRNRGWRYGCVGLGAIATAAITAANPDWVQAWEYQVQTIWQETRGAVVPPDNVIILAIDDASLAQGALYRDDPQGLKALAPIQTWPWRRQAYAQVIDRLMAAGARAVGIDVLFTTPSVYGAADDRALAEALQRAGDRVVLASKYDTLKIRQGSQLQLVTPLAAFNPAQTGFVNMPKEADGRIHRLGQTFADRLFRQPGFDEALPFERQPSFAAAILQASRHPQPTPGDHIVFFGPHATFPHIPFWTVLDPDSWQTSLQGGQVFRDKIVLIGSTAPVHQDQQRVPFANSWRYPEPMFGVEVQANAVANLHQGIALRSLMPTPSSNALLTGLVVVLVGGVLQWRKAPLTQLGLTVASLGTWVTISYGLFVYGHYWVPIALPLAQVMVELTRRQSQTKKLRETLKSHLSLPLIQEIVDQQEDLRDLLVQREQEVHGQVLRGRYQIAKLLGVGGFGETYIAKDLQRPGQPLCVVKQLKLGRHSSRRVALMRRLFKVEAEALEKLGNHDQIPRLLAYFEEFEEFYLVQELIVGTLLNHDLKQGRLAPSQIWHLLQDVLTVLAFVHDHQVLHRDIKPSNLIRRSVDGKWVLIDFGVAKQLTYMPESGEVVQTVGVGTKGYVPAEQALGQPNPTSDLYALGMTAIEALTGVSARDLPITADGEVTWLDHAPVLSPEFINFLNTLIRADHRYRPPDAETALAVLQKLPEAHLPVTHLSPASHAVPRPSPTLVAESLPTKCWKTQPEDTTPIGSPPESGM
jgi:CHASE2 domain-containing sensor protein/tRNA A-37 threonylcarbamoyl transferase component Bud32